MSGGFLRFDRSELEGDRLVILAVDAGLRESRRRGSVSPLGYLYERPDPDAPDCDLSLAAGHYDRTNLVWVFSGEVPGIIGITEPTTPAADTPHR